MVIFLLVTSICPLFLFTHPFFSLFVHSSIHPLLYSFLFYSSLSSFLCSSSTSPSFPLSPPPQLYSYILFLPVLLTLFLLFAILPSPCLALYLHLSSRPLLRLLIIPPVLSCFLSLFFFSFFIFISPQSLSALPVSYTLVSSSNFSSACRFPSYSFPYFSYSSRLLFSKFLRFSLNLKYFFVRRFSFEQWQQWLSNVTFLS